MITLLAALSAHADAIDPTRFCDMDQDGAPCVTDDGGPGTCAAGECQPYPARAEPEPSADAPAKAEPIATPEPAVAAEPTLAGCGCSTVVPGIGSVGLGLGLLVARRRLNPQSSRSL